MNSWDGKHNLLIAHITLIIIYWGRSSPPLAAAIQFIHSAAEAAAAAFDDMTADSPAGGGGSAPDAVVSIINMISISFDHFKLNFHSSINICMAAMKGGWDERRERTEGRKCCLSLSLTGPFIIQRVSISEWNGAFKCIIIS